MKLLKLTIAVAVSGLFIGAGQVARAVTHDGGGGGPVSTYTYMFTASPGEDTNFDGSTITIQGTADDASIISWDLIDLGAPLELTHVASPAGGNSYVAYENIWSFDVNSWSGYFTIAEYGEALRANSYEYGNPEFYGGNNTEAGNYLNDNVYDPNGNWARVPDAANSFQLLSLALAALGVFRSRKAMVVRA